MSSLTGVVSKGGHWPCVHVLCFLSLDFFGIVINARHRMGFLRCVRVRARGERGVEPAQSEDLSDVLRS
jgi:hypothetical protein